jgi:hypothetical protein
MPFSPSVSTIAETIQLSLSPVFMLAGIAAIINVLAGRLSRVIDRVRALEASHGGLSSDERARTARELRLANRRMGIVNRAIFLATSSAVMTCAVVATLFVAELGHLKIGRWVAFAFIAAMALLIASLIAFALEVRLSLRANRVRPELMELP